MPTARKEADVAELRDMVSRATISISATYRGLSVADMTALRRKLREAGVEVRVIKNSLFRRAADQAGKAQVAEIATGPTAILFGYGDVAASAKSVQEFLRANRNTSLAVQAAYFDGQVLGPEALADLASLPSKEQLLADFMGGLRSPIANFASLMSATIQGFAGLIDARAQQLEAAA